MAADTVRKRALFQVGEDVYRWIDVVRLARLRGDWEAIASEARAGLAALRAGAQPDPEKVQAAAREFRYARHLLAADELEAWLERRGLTTSDWHGYLDRGLARSRFEGDVEVGPEPDEEVVWAEGICSGRLEQLARELAELVAVRPGLPIEQLDAALDDFRREAATQQAIAREVEVSRLELMRVELEAMTLADEDMASEAALLVSTDGLPFAEAAAQAGVASERDEAWLDELEPAFASKLLAGRPGDLIGPLPVDEGFLLVRLGAKIPPSAEDTAVRERAERAVVARAVARRVDEHVRWLDRL